MNRVVRAALGLGLAFGLSTIVRRMGPDWAHLLSVYTLLVIYFALRGGELAGALMGTAAGLLLDAFSLGVFGISGLSLTLTGYLAGLVSRKINVLSVTKSFLFILVFVELESLLWLGLVSLLLSGGSQPLRDLLLLRPPVTAAAGALLFGLLRRARTQHG